MKPTNEASKSEPWGDRKLISKSMIEDYRKVFLETPEGKRILGHLGEVMFFFSDTVNTQEERVLANAFRCILARCGIWLQPNSEQIIEALSDVVLKPEEDKPGQKSKLAKLMEQKYGS